MMEYMHRGVEESRDTYEVDTVLEDGSIDTMQVPLQAVYSLGRPQDKRACFQAVGALPQGYVLQCSNLSVCCLWLYFTT